MKWDWPCRLYNTDNLQVFQYVEATLCTLPVMNSVVKALHEAQCG